MKVAESNIAERVKRKRKRAGLQGIAREYISETPGWFYHYGGSVQWRNRDVFKPVGTKAGRGTDDPHPYCDGERR